MPVGLLNKPEAPYPSEVPETLPTTVVVAPLPLSATLRRRLLYWSTTHSEPPAGSTAIPNGELKEDVAPVAPFVKPATVGVPATVDTFAAQPLGSAPLGKGGGGGGGCAARGRAPPERRRT